MKYKFLGLYDEDMNLKSFWFFLIKKDQMLIFY